MAQALTTGLLVIGIVVLIGGLGMVVFSDQDAQDNEEQPFSDDDEDRADRNEQLQTAGWITAGVGGLVTLLGIVAAVARRS